MPMQPPTAAERKKMLEMGISQADIDREFGPEPITAPKRPTLESVRAQAEATGPRLTPQQLAEQGKYFAPEMAHAMNIVSGLPGVERGFMKEEFAKAREQTGGVASALGRSVVPAALLAATGPASAIGRILTMAGYGAAKGGLESESLGRVIPEAAKGAAIQGGGQAIGEGAMSLVPFAAKAAWKGATAIPKAGPFIQEGGRQIAEGWASNVQQPISQFLANRAASIGPESSVAGWKGPLEAASQFAAPRNATMAGRIAAEELPGAVGERGLTVATLKERAKQAGQRVKELEPVVQQAKETAEEIPKRASGLQKTIEARATAASKAQSEAQIAALQDRARQIAGKLATPEELANAYRQSIVEAKRNAGDEGYALIQQMGPLEQTPLRTYQRIQANEDMAIGFESAVKEQRARLLNKRLNAEGGSAFERVPEVRLPTEKIGVKRVNPQTGEVEEQTMTQITPETFDLMRRSVRERASTPKESGVYASREKQAYADIDAAENEFIAQLNLKQQEVYYGTRAAQRAYEEALDGNKLGLSLSEIKPSATPTRKTPGEFNLDNVMERLAKSPANGGFSDSFKEGFRVGAQNAISNMIREASDVGAGSASKALASLVSSPAARQRTAMVLGEDMVNQIAAVIPEVIEGAGAAAAATALARGAARTARVGQVGQRMTAQAKQSAEKLARELSQTQERAARMGEIAGVAEEMPAAMLGSDLNAQAAFMQNTARRLGGGLQPATRNLGGSLIQRQIAGKSPQEALAALQEMAKNPVNRSLLGSELDATIARLQQATKPRFGAAKPYGALLGTTGIRNMLIPEY